MSLQDSIKAISKTARELLPQFGGDRVTALHEAARRHGVKPSQAPAAVAIASDGQPVNPENRESTFGTAKPWSEVIRAVNAEAADGRSRPDATVAGGALPWSEVMRRIGAKGNVEVSR